MTDLNHKAAAAAIRQILGIDLEKAAAHPALPKLLEAKRESDERNYPAKHSILRALILEHPEHFKVDSEDKHVVGLTHESGFRIHMPRTAVPTMPKPLRKLTEARHDVA